MLSTPGQAAREPDEVWSSTKLTARRRMASLAKRMRREPRVLEVEFDDQILQVPLDRLLHESLDDLSD